MSISNLPDQKTPGRPVEITFAADTGTPSANQEVLLIGHAATGIDAGNLYEVLTVDNSGDDTSAADEMDTKLGGDCELKAMVLAAIRANKVTGRFVQLKIVPLASSDTAFGAADIALTNIDRVKAEFVVSPYDGQDDTLRGKLKTLTSGMSAPTRVDNNQFGTMGVVFNRTETDPANLTKFDTQYLIGVWMPDTGAGLNAPAYTIGEMAAAAAALIAGNPAPFNPLDDVTLNEVAAPLITSDYITVGFGRESEVALNQGWTPLKVKANGEVAFVRTVTGRLSADGSGTPVVTSYYDVQDFQVLFFWRKTMFTRYSQPDFKQRKASTATAQEIKAEAIRLAKLFEEQQMFQAVDQLAKQFVVERQSSDRSRFNLLTPVNVIPGLHVIATNVQATTEFDVLTV